MDIKYRFIIKSTKRGDKFWVYDRETDAKVSGNFGSNADAQDKKASLIAKITGKKMPTKPAKKKKSSSLRKFDGKIFSHYGTVSTKRERDHKKKKWQDKGFKVRTVKTNDGYQIYTRK